MLKNKKKSVKICFFIIKQSSLSYINNITIKLRYIF